MGYVLHNVWSRAPILLSLSPMPIEKVAACHSFRARAASGSGMRTLPLLYTGKQRLRDTNMNYFKIMFLFYAVLPERSSHFLTITDCRPFLCAICESSINAQWYCIVAGKLLNVRFAETTKAQLFVRIAGAAHVNGRVNCTCTHCHPLDGCSRLLKYHRDAGTAK